MKTFRSATGKRRSTAFKAGKRLAFGAALSAALGSSCFAQELPLPSWETPKVSKGQDNLDVPYPYAVSEQQTSVQKIVGILGLTNQSAAVPAHPALPPLANANTPSANTRSANKPVNVWQQTVVPASATEKAPTPKPTTGTPTDPVQLPVISAPTNFNDQSATLGASGFGEQSLLDVDIPLPGEQVSRPSVSAPSVATANSGLPKEALPPVIQAPQRQPAQNTFSAEAASPSDVTVKINTKPSSSSVELKMTVSAPQEKLPEVVTRTKKMRLNVAPPAVAPPALTARVSPKSPVQASESKAESDTQFNLSDSPPEKAIAKQNSVKETISEGAAVLAKLVKGSATSDDAEFHLSDENSKQSPTKNTNRPMAVAANPASKSPLKLSKPKRLNAPPASTTDVAAAQISGRTSARRVKANLASSKKSVVKKAEPAKSQPMILPVSPEQMTTGEAVALETHALTSLMVDSAILQCSAEHPAICKVIRTGEKSLSVIGLQNGKTRIAIVTAPEGGKQMVEIREVLIGSEQTKQVSLKQIANEVSKTVAKLYPDSDITLLPEGDRLILDGFVNSEKEARRVLSLVRKTTLAPVVDQLQVQKN